MNEIIKGKDGLRNIIRAYKKLLIVHGSSYNRYDIKKIFDDIPHVDFTDFDSNPLYEDVCKGVDVFNSHNCDVIVAIGGGSAIDVAKCIKLFCKMDKRKNYLKQKRENNGIVLIAIPTTAGTGSESTKHAVIYFKGEKQSVSHDSIVPDYAFLIPEFLTGLPIYQKKCTLLDALCQAIESWWSVKSDDVSKAYSKKAIVNIRDNWREYIKDNSEKAAEKIMAASNYAGRAINIAETTSAHAMSYKITSLYKVPHGHAVAICMTEIWKYILNHQDKCTDSRGDKYLKNVLKDIESLVSYDWYCNLLMILDIAKPVASNKESEIKLLVESVNLERLKNTPVEFSTKVLREMYERIIEV
ncbi:MAG: phosphonoacetaldehyde reductase [Hungatella sp.]|nr:phosphonoacetaldehyde reductase [Hungatella sp.]